jgi:hypothetical protein
MSMPCQIIADEQTFEVAARTLLNAQRSTSIVSKAHSAHRALHPNWVRQKLVEIERLLEGHVAAARP